MPDYDEAEPFVVEITYRYENVNGVEVGYGRAFRLLRSTVPFPGWNSDRFCLGEAAYGGEVRFQVAASERASNCFSAPTGSIEVDSFAILVAEEAECPPPGGLLNPTAEVGGGGWVFDVEQGGSSEGFLADGVGEDESDGARIYKPAGSATLAAMHTQLSIPLPTDSFPSPALRFWWKGSSTGEYYVDLGTYPGTRSTLRPLDWLSGNGAEQVSTYCLPPWTHGNVVDLSFVPLGVALDDAAELVVDDVELVSDPVCGTSRDLFDPGFDSAPNRWPGATMARNVDPESEVTVISDPERARPPGAGALELRYGSN